MIYTDRCITVKSQNCLLNIEFYYILLLGVDLTGYFVNPVNASNQTFGCHGTSALEHIIIYWLGPMTGAACGVVLRNHLWELFGTITKDTSVKAYSNSNGKHTSNEKHTSNGNSTSKRRSHTSMNGNTMNAHENHNRNNDIKNDSIKEKSKKNLRPRFYEKKSSSPEDSQSNKKSNAHKKCGKIKNKKAKQQ